MKSLIIRRALTLLPMFALAPGAPTCAATEPQPLGKPLPDYTDKLQLKPGMRVSYAVHDGLDTRWKHLGDYEFTADVEPKSKDYAFSYRWMMSAPLDASGIRAVSVEDLAKSHKLSLFYTDKQNCGLVGYTNLLRISDDLFGRLKRQEKTEFELDGPEVMQVYHKDTVPLPHFIQAVGEEQVNVMVNDTPAQVRAIKTETNNGWHYWVMDNPSFPIVVKAEGPFQWDPPTFSIPNLEGNRIVDDLKLHGIATTHAILFDFDKDILKPQSKPILDTIGKYLQTNPAIRLNVEGHCDIMGGYDYNMNLSMRRANAVRKYLIQSCGIAGDRLRAKGYGYTKPIADNKTPQGRALNRRVVFKQF